MTFSDVFSEDRIHAACFQAQQVSPQMVRQALLKPKRTLDNFITLLSPAALETALDPMIAISRQITQQRFGKTMQMFAPMYLSNVCYNQCTYCGFSMEHSYPRVVLTDAEIEKEAEILTAKGFRHILLLTGEAPDKAGVPYIAQAIRRLKPYFSSIGIEIQPLKSEDYTQLVEAGADSLTIYQETYHHPTYLNHHLRGKKRNYAFRLDTPDRAGNTGFYRMNIGALLGLYEWRFEAFSLAMHLAYLQKRYWRVKYSVSFPRIRDMYGPYVPPFSMTDREVMQFIAAFRLVFPDLGITLSTRELPELRDQLIHVGVTAMSAESHTEPGGYSGKEAEGQFEISDPRSLSDIRHLLEQNEIEPVFKDWDPEFLKAVPLG